LEDQGVDLDSFNVKDIINIYNGGGIKVLKSRFPQYSKLYTQLVALGKLPSLKGSVSSKTSSADPFGRKRY